MPSELRAVPRRTECAAAVSSSARLVASDRVVCASAAALFLFLVSKPRDPPKLSRRRYQHCESPPAPGSERASAPQKVARPRPQSQHGGFPPKPARSLDADGRPARRLVFLAIAPSFFLHPRVVHAFVFQRFPLVPLPSLVLPTSLRPRACRVLLAFCYYFFSFSLPLQQAWAATSASRITKDTRLNSQ